MTSPSYIGRFAPSPTGPLHFGSLVCAVGSYLDAVAHGGTWLIRMEDLDPPREMPGAAERILHSLDTHELHSQRPIEWQSRRHHLYQNALEQLREKGLVYPCGCTREQIRRSEKLHDLFTITVAAVTSALRGTPTEVELGIEEGLKHTCCVNLCNLFTVRQGEVGAYVGTVSREKMTEVCRALAIACACE